MDITFLGHASFRLKGKTAALVTDPFSPEMVGLKFPKVSAEIVTISHGHEDHNQVDLVKGVKRVINGPGEYEIQGVSIMGFASFHDDKKGQLRGKNTIYVIEIDGLRLAHLGDLGHKLNEKTVEEMGGIDVLMVPVGGVYTINASEAAEVVRAIEPNITIPMHYQMDGLKREAFEKLTGLKPFLADVGLTVDKTNKLSVKRSTIEEEQKVVVLEKRP